MRYRIRKCKEALLLLPAMLRFHRALGKASWYGWNYEDYQRAANDPELLGKLSDHNEPGWVATS